jgi:uncharacterized protein YegP (UPF0339 family)
MHFEIYRDKVMEFRWRLVASNGRIVGDSGEGYRRKARVKEMLTRIAEAFDVPVDVTDIHAGESYTI